MKKFISIVAGLVVALASYAETTHFSQQIINGQNLVVSNNTTVNWNSTNVWYVSPAGTNVQSFVTNTAGILQPTALKDVNGVSIEGGFVNTNMAIQVVVGQTNYVQAQNAQFNAPAVAPVSIIIPDVNATNTLTFTFQRSCDGVYYGSTAQDQFVFSVIAPGAASPTMTQLVVATNLPPILCAGTRKWRLKSVAASSVSSSTGTIINSITLNGFTP